ncbi:hypothetical protein CSUB01_04646 [Colletotrichum sublineola]|uniref:Major facilitator superfamily (MFS) profile domain-containing protein n=1 Tax=Colletotrichum sublineola TaxID=1173701 RepID=A0A066X4A8_COLSU|nr:hypothetical protein CSUB01_04646 [Colletotrichum sublineola]
MPSQKDKAITASDSNSDDSSASTVQAQLATDDGEHAEKGSSSQMSPQEPCENNHYPSGLSLALILTSCFMCTLLTSLDRLIITTAIPKITDEFKSVTDIACSIVFIVGRAIAGLGAAGILTGVIVIFVHALPLHKRPLYQGMFGAVFGISSVTGPLLGGAFTSKVSWRWCFYINLPLGSVAAVVIYLILKIPDKEPTQLSIAAKLKQLDFYGTGCLVPGSVSMILALQWGGSSLAWNDRKVIALLVLSGFMFIGFVLFQSLLPKTATIPPRIFNQRSILAGFFSTICIGSQTTIFAFYIPIWFQAIQGVSAVESGIRFLPLVLSMVVSMLSSGVLIRNIGYYTPVMIFGVCFMAIGAGLLYTLQVNAVSAQWIGYQIIYGLGAGCATQVPNIAAQTVLPKGDVPIGISLMYFGNFMGSAIFLSVSQNILNNQLLRRLQSIPGIDPGMILDNGVTSLTNLPQSIRGTVLVAYNEAIRRVFLLALILVCLAMLGASSLEWRSTKKDVDKMKAGN